MRHALDQGTATTLTVPALTDEQLTDVRRALDTLVLVQGSGTATSVTPNGRACTIAAINLALTGRHSIGCHTS